MKELELRKERLQALTHWCGVYRMEQIQEVLEQEGYEATVACLTAALGVKQGGRDTPAAWQETLSPSGTQKSGSLERYDQLMGVS
ncbi:hypothetical protein P4K96_28095 [Bacillus cereus]|uniref:hypothetical protein n=1 Tax=Paenibacillus TaxID=44249 RepID=UPI001BCFB697|nr:MULTISPECIES: hypothetical protein [Paenibacillus]MEB9897281.1 hypothetical protein [Bacillus cereus]CAH8721163.1 hypothetical protein HTL2_006221 [Paenibacillus melissococcoides]